MKTFTKLALTTAIAAAPFMAQAELQMMDEASLSSTTGQAGVTIETSALVTVEQVVYQDVNTANTGAGTVASPDNGNYGTVAIDGISLSDTSGNAINITQTIDVNDDGKLEVGISGITNLRLQVANMTIGSSAAQATPGTALTGLTQGTGGAASDSMGALRVDVGTVSALTQTIRTGGDAGQGLTIGVGATTVTGIDVTYVDGAYQDSTSDNVANGSNALEITGMSLSVTPSGGATEFEQKIDVIQEGGVAKLQLKVDTGADINLGIDSIALAAGGVADSAAAGYTTLTSGASMGSFAVTGLNMAGTTTKIYGH